MQSLIKTCALSLMVAGLTACGGSGGGGKKPEQPPVSSSSSSSSIAPSSSSIASSFTPASSSSSTPASSSEASSSVASSAAAGSENTLAATTYTNYSVAEIANCGVNITAADKTFAFFADYDSGVQNQSVSSLNFSGWNHATNGSTTEWVNLKNTPNTYNFSTSAAVNDSCNGVDTINVVLVKKVADWDRQHSNGFERSIISYGYKFGDIENLVLDLKINSAKTTIPSVDSLKTTYASYVNAATVDGLDSGKVNLGITLHDGGNLNAAIIVELDQSTLKDKWVRVTIPMKNLTFYSEVNYVRTAKTLADLSNVVIKRGLFVGETRTGAVLRGNINPWSANVPETFKETDISFKKIEFQLK
ncbi:hypothetical protein [Cellvibrio mixtus]|uniref:hypothetical protein n=1 Tax=Cellvibrio mixtus TaxID=39650 RepID=UPI000587B774|nr:hypothetical protein [Cellvibrio mixtus]